jgi:hypothetical protein
MGLYGSPELGPFDDDERMPKRRKPKTHMPKWISIVAAILIAYFIISKMGFGKVSVPNMPKTIGNTENIPIVGSRKNPAKVNQPVQADIQDQSGSAYRVEVTLIDFRRGEEAEKILRAWHSTGDPGEGKEHGLAKFKIKYLEDKSGKDVPLTLSGTSFLYSTGDYKVSTLTWDVPGMDPAMTGQLYEGADHQGWICYSLEKDDTAPKVVFAQCAWFDLIK